MAATFGDDARDHGLGALIAVFAAVETARDGVWEYSS